MKPKQAKKVLTPGAYIVYGKSKNSRVKIIKQLIQDDLEILPKKDNPDYLQIECEEDKNTIGIDLIRGMSNFIIQKPFSHFFKAVLIIDSHKLTTQAQNALLKTLEETPSYAVIILESSKTSDLLPTIVSRCKHISISKGKSFQNAQNEDISKYDSKIINNSLDEILMWVVELSKEDTNTIITTLQQETQVSRATMLDVKTSQRNKLYLSHNLRILNDTINDFNSLNINKKLALERMAMSLKLVSLKEHN